MHVAFVTFFSCFVNGEEEDGDLSSLQRTSKPLIWQIANLCVWTFKKIIKSTSVCSNILTLGISFPRMMISVRF